jgi:hypothetical protein
MPNKKARTLLNQAPPDRPGDSRIEADIRGCLLDAVLEKFPAVKRNDFNETFKPSTTAGADATGWGQALKAYTEYLHGINPEVYGKYVHHDGYADATVNLALPAIIGYLKKKLVEQIWGKTS